jgi:hypothetical protein
MSPGSGLARAAAAVFATDHHLTSKIRTKAQRAKTFHADRWAEKSSLAESLGTTRASSRNVRDVNEYRA